MSDNTAMAPSTPTSTSPSPDMSLADQQRAAILSEDRRTGRPDDHSQTLWQALLIFRLLYPPRRSTPLDGVGQHDGDQDHQALG